MSIVSQSLDYQKKSVSHPTYQLSKTTPQTGSTSVTVTTAGGNESVFELSAKVMNLSKSILSFSALYPDLDTKYNWVYTEGIPLIRQIQLYTRTGIYLCDINDLNKYLKMQLRQSHAIEDVLTYDKIESGSGYFEGLTCCNTSTLTDVEAIRPNNTTVKTIVSEPQYLTVGAVGDDAVQGDVTINFQVPLARIVDSILSLDKDQFFGEITYLRIVWASSLQGAFTGDAADDPTDAPVAFAKDITVSNLTLYTAIEQNPVINQEIMSKFNSGSLTYLVPYVYQNKQSLDNTQQNLSVKYNIAHGQKLKKILVSPFNITERENTAYDNNNVADAKVLDYYTMLNNVRTSQFNYDTSAGDDWLAKKHLFKGSCIQSSNEYYYNWTAIEDFTAETGPEVNTENLDDGLDLTNEIKYDLIAVTANATHMWYVYAITQKSLKVQPEGVVLF
eukprot:Lithocolla_globosa_v1_NODE_4730_length_1378_cov_357.560847.p1 type:complete len:445 gc:universal NODE_4730_length_1378_cov_357.560847:1-1335(+)